MNGRQLTDAQIAQALRAHVPERATAGLRERVLDEAATAAQQRPLPSFLAGLADADPMARRRSLLLAAALLIALTLGVAAGVGAWLESQRRVPDFLLLAPPTDMQAFVLSSYDRMPQLPPLVMTTLDNGSTKGRIYVHESGAIRFEKFSPADETQPDTYKILRGTSLGQLVSVGSDKVWVEQDGAISEDPRVFILAEIGSGAVYLGGPGCEMTRNGEGAGNGTSATAWRYVGLEYVAGRPAHHVACEGDLWLDVETRLILRSQGARIEFGVGAPVEDSLRTIEVTEIEFGEQPAELFDIAPPNGVARMPAEAYDQYRCSLDPICSATPSPPTPRPSAAPCPPASSDPPVADAGLAWSESSLEKDWPAPVRAETVEGRVTTLETDGRFDDPLCDIGPGPFRWLDISNVRLSQLSPGPGTVVSVNMAADMPMPVVGPSRQWIAYGLVLDTNGDGVPDIRLGIDNMPEAPNGEPGHRAWRTDLHSGGTMAAAGAPYGVVGDIYLDTFYPGEGAPNAARFGVALRPDEPLFRFHAWASLIEDGRVVATDYAPDVGWLDAPDAIP
jgi:hypothetical protein